MSLGYVTNCLVRDELDAKYYVNLWENELKRTNYGGDYHMGSLDPKVKEFVCYFHCLLFAIVCSILVLLWQGHPLHKGPMGGRSPQVCYCWPDNYNPFPFSPLVYVNWLCILNKNQCK